MPKAESPALEQGGTGRSLRDIIRNSNWRRRRQYMIDREFQLRVLRQFLGVVLVALILAAYVTHVVGWMYGAYSSGALSDRYAHWTEHVLVWVFGGGSLIVSGAIFYLISIFYSHRIAGPAWKLRTALHQLAEGGLPRPVKLRDTDYLQDLAKAVNHADRSWRQTIEQIEEALGPLQGDADALDAATVQRQVEAIQSALSRYQRKAPDSEG
jgi:methyl-accepting chemotaxis protein